MKSVEPKVISQKHDTYNRDRKSLAKDLKKCLFFKSKQIVMVKIKRFQWHMRGRSDEI